MERYLRNRITTAHLAWNPYFHDPKLVHRLHRISAPTLVVWGRTTASSRSPTATAGQS